MISDAIASVVTTGMDWWQNENRQSDLYDQSFQTQERQQAYNKYNAKMAYDRSQAAVRDQWKREVDAYKNRFAWTAKSLEDAGLNPILALGKGFAGVSAPKGTTATAPMASSSAVPMQGVQPMSFSNSAKNIAGALKSYTEAKKGRKELGLIEARIDETTSNAAKMRIQAKVFTQQEKETIEKIKEIQGIIKLNTEKEKLTIQEKESVKQYAKKLKAETTKLQKMADIYDTPAGTVMLWIKTVLDTAGIPITGILGYGAGKYIRGSKKVNLNQPKHFNEFRR